MLVGSHFCRIVLAFLAEDLAWMLCFLFLRFLRHSYHSQIIRNSLENL